MNVLVPLLIVAINPDAPIEARPPGATEVFHCPFDASWDKNFDREPDRWVRRSGPGFPRYVTVQISEEPSSAGGRSLRIDLDGGAAATYSPPVPIGPLHTYVLEGLLFTERLEHDRAFFSLTVLDQQRHRLGTFYSEKVADSHGWKKLRLGPLTFAENARFAVIGLHVEPSLREDLTGSVRFADVWLGRLPRISLSTDRLHNVFTEADEITITCSASGLSQEDAPAVFHLDDAFGAEIAKDLVSGESGVGSPEWEVRSGESALGDGSPPIDHQPSIIHHQFQWKPPVPGPGFYRVRAAIRDRDDVVHRRELTLAVIRPSSALSGSEFGWSLPRGDKPLGPAELSELVGHAGIGWVKYPLWLDEQASDEHVHELARFSERLSDQGIELVGLLHDPPEALRSQFGNPKSSAEIFAADSQLWYPSLASAITRLGIQVRWWQVGEDKDTGFVGYPKLEEKAAEIKAQLDQLSHDVNVGFGWSWTAPLPEPAGGKAPWRFLALSADPPLAEQEMSVRLAAAGKSPVRRWVVLEPLPRDRHSLETRAIDLVRRMVCAKIDGAEGIFIPDPFSTDRGLMNDDGTAGELFLPWRTSALMLGGAESLGSIRLPGGSRNHIFARGGDAVMIVWSDPPREEVIYLGRKVGQVDLWGRSTTPRQQEHRQVIEAGPLPTFVSGIDERLVRWRQSLSLASDVIPSVAGARHQNSLRLKSPFEGEVTGHFEMVVPESWTVTPRRTEFRLARDEQLEQPFQIALPYNPTSGRHPIRVDFELRADQTYRFSVYRHIDVGTGEVYIEVVTRLNDRGELEVEQHFVNDAQSPVSFRCHLFAPDRRRQNTQIVGLERGRDVNTYRLPDGEQLIGKTLWLRAEQIDGPRVLNYRFVVKG